MGQGFERLFPCFLQSAVLFVSLGESCRISFALLENLVQQVFSLSEVAKATENGYHFLGQLVDGGGICPLPRQFDGLLKMLASFSLVCEA